MRDGAPRAAWVYLLECRDGSFYAGWTYDPAARLQAHNAGTGAKYTRSRLPVRLVYREVLPDKSAALRRERELKKMSHEQKRLLIEKLM